MTETLCVLVLVVATSHRSVCHQSSLNYITMGAFYCLSVTARQADLVWAVLFLWGSHMPCAPHRLCPPSRGGLGALGLSLDPWLAGRGHTP